MDGSSAVCLLCSGISVYFMSYSAILMAINEISYVYFTKFGDL